LKRGANSVNFVKIAQGIRPCEAFVFRNLVKFQYNFQFWGPAPLSLHRWGEVLHGGVHSSMPNFTPVGATCRPKIAVRV